MYYGYNTVIISSIHIGHNTMLSTAHLARCMPLSNHDLMYEMTRSAAFLNAVNWHFIDLLGEFDQRGIWRDGGYSSLVNWLDHRCGMAPGAARERIRVARKLRDLKLIDHAFETGKISYSKVRAITRAATPEAERTLLKMACRCSAAELESLVRTYERTGASRGDRNDQTEKRFLEWYYDDEGMLVLNARLPADVGAVVVKALDKAVDLRKEEREDYFKDLYLSPVRDDACQPDPEVDSAACTDSSGSAEESQAESAGCRSDHLQTDSATDLPPDSEETDPQEQEEPVSESSDPDTQSTTQESEGDVSAETLRLLFTGWSNPRQLSADGLCDIAEHWLATAEKGAKRRPNHSRYEVVLHIDRNELAAASHPRYYLERGTAVTQETGRRIACDAQVSQLIEDAHGMLLKLGRKQRIVPPLLLKALKRRDKRCRFPGCSHVRYLAAHHIKHWIDGGETDANNLVMLCSRHHALLHDGRYSIRVQTNGRAIFYDRHNEVIDQTIFPQFQNSPRNFNGLKVKDPPAGQVPHQSLLDKNSERDLVKMLHFREQWGRRKPDRMWDQMMRSFARKSS